MEERFRIEREVASRDGSSISDFDSVMHLADNQEYKDYVFEKYIVTKRIIGFDTGSENDGTGNLAKIKTSMTFYSKRDYEEFENDPIIKNFRETGSKLNSEMIVNLTPEVFDVEDGDVETLKAPA